MNEQGPAVGDMVRRQVGPIMQDLIKEQIAPAVHDVIDHQLSPAVLGILRQGEVDTLKLSVRPDLQPDVIQNAHNASVGASQVTHDALVNAGVVNDSGQLTAHVRLYLWVAVVGGILVVVAMLSLLVTLNLLALHYWRNRPGSPPKPAAT